MLARTSTPSLPPSQGDRFASISRWMELSPRWGQLLTTLVILGRISLILLGVSTLTHCAPPGAPDFEIDRNGASIESTMEGRILAERLRGKWDLSTLSTSTECPVELDPGPLDGITDWDADGNQVEVLWKDGVGVLELWAVNGESLKTQNSIEEYGCEATQDITLQIEELTSRFIRAAFVVYYYHNGADACTVGTSMYDFPDQCQITVDWVGYRQASPENAGETSAENPTVE